MGEPGATRPYAVRTWALRKRFGRMTALAGVDLAVPEGAVYLLVGPNGAGKTTTIQVLLDLVVADSGTAEIAGIDSRRDGARLRAQVGYVPERDDGVYGWMRVSALLRYHAGYYPAWDHDYATELMRRLEIPPAIALRKLSKGFERRVRFVLALAHRPRVLLLDEPTDGLDPVVREDVLALLAEHLARFPATVLLSTHQVHEAERLADHVGFIRGGRIDLQVTRESLRRNLREYRLDLPRDWAGSPELEGSVLRRQGDRREVGWTIWGEETEVSERLRDAGATIRGVETLTLSEAARALLSRRARGVT